MAISFEFFFEFGYIPSELGFRGATESKKNSTGDGTSGPYRYTGLTRELYIR